MTILLVNTQEDITNRLTSWLEQWGNQVALAETDNQALQMLRKHNIQLLIKDWTTSAINHAQPGKIHSLNNHYIHSIAIIDESLNSNTITEITAEADSVLHKPLDSAILRTHILSAKKTIAIKNQPQEQDAQSQHPNNQTKEISAQFSNCALKTQNEIQEHTEVIVLKSTHSDASGF